NLTLTYHGPTATYELETRPMYGPDADKQAELDEAYQKKYWDLELLQELVAQIQVCNKSADAYEYAKRCVDSSWAYINYSNVYSAEARAFVEKKLNAINKKYGDRTLTIEEANSVYDDWTHTVNGTMFYGFYSDYDGDGIDDRFNQADYPDYPVIYYLHDAWRFTKNSTGVAVYADENFHTNGWSNEGDPTQYKNTSGMSVPFIEYWRDSTLPLEAGKITATARDLEPGYLYSVSMFARVCKQGSDVDDLHGIYFNAETPANKTDSTLLTTGKKYYDANGALPCIAGYYQVDSLIVRSKDDGTAEVTITIDDETNVTWLAYKFVHFEKGRKLWWYEENTPATQEELDSLDALIAWGKERPIGFCQEEYATYANADVRKALDDAATYRKGTELIEDSVLYFISKLQKGNWHQNSSDTNAIYNPNFSIRPNNVNYDAMVGWRMVDKTKGTDEAISGGSGRPGIIYDAALVNFKNSTTSGGNNTAGLLKYAANGIKSITSSSTEYFYGDSTYYEMPLRCETDEVTGALGTNYRLKFEYGGWTKSYGSVVYGIKDPKGEILEEWTITCDNSLQTDTSYHPQIAEQVFTTTSAGNHTLYFKNADTKKSHNIVISNMELTRNPKVIMQITSAKYGTFICPFAVKIPKKYGITAWAVVGVDDNSHVYTDDETGMTGNYRTLILTDKVTEKYRYNAGGSIQVGETVIKMNQADTTYIPAHTPVVVRSDKSQSKLFGGNATKPIDHSLTYGLLTGFYNDSSCVLMDSNADTAYYALQKHSTSQEACFYRISYAEYLAQNSRPLTLNVSSYRCILKLPASQAYGAKTRMLMFNDLDEMMKNATFISSTDDENGDKDIVAIYSPSGVPLKSMQKGVNIVKYSNGSSKKIYIK
nr:hypothetical protein [Bacteroidaceae bacterium]